MKKKSLLILPVLLLALAACNKEDDEVIEDDGTVVDPSGDQGTDDGGSGNGGDGGEKEPVVDTRITLATGSYILNPTEGEEGAVTGVEYANPASGLSIASVVAGVDENGGANVTYTLTGTAAKMTSEQAADFWSGYSAVGDKYIVVSIEVKDGETLSWTGSDGTKREEYESDDIVIRISGYGVSSDKLATGTTTYTITDAAGVSVDHIVDFSALLGGIALSTESISEGNNITLDQPFENPSDLVIASVETSYESDKVVYTYTLEGTAGVMTATQAEDFWKDHAAEGDKYIILTVSFAEDETLSWVSSAGDKRERTVADYPDCSMDVVIRISGTDVSSEIASGTTTYTTTDGATHSVTHVIDFSALLSTDGGDGGDTGNDEP